MRYLFLFALFFATAFAQAEPPEILSGALNAYLKDGRSAFLPVLLKGSALENEKSVLAQENMIGQVESYYGKPLSWETLAVCELNDRIRTTYYVVYHEKGPVFGYVDSYEKKSGKEIATQFQLHTESQRILPYKSISKEDICDA